MSTSSRKRVNYQCEVLAVGPTCATDPHFSINGSGIFSDSYNEAIAANPQFVGILGEDTFDADVKNLVRQLHRIQSASYSASIERTPVNQFGELAAIDRVATSSPIANLEFSYLLANFVNEGFLGFDVDGQINCLSHILNKTQDEKNYFIKTVSEGKDAVGDDSNEGESIGIGNGYITSYNSEASVGGFPTVNVSVEGLNMVFYNGVSGKLIPAINVNDGSQATGSQFHIPNSFSHPSGVIDGDLSLSVLRPGDIRISLFKRTSDAVSIADGTFDAPGVNLSNACIQSYNLSFDLNREAIQCMGQRYAVSREITPPIETSLSIDALVGDLTTGSISEVLNCNYHYDVMIDLYRPTCVGQATSKVVSYIMKDFTIDNWNFDSSIGDNKSVTIEFMGYHGGPNKLNRGVFMSGIHIPSGVF